MKWQRFFLFPLSLFATVNEPLRWEFFSGYRNDRIHWHLQQPADDGALTYRELYRNLQFWENGLAFKVIHRDLVFFARGSYAAFGRGILFQKYADLTFTSDHPHFHFASHGWAADTSGYLGYAVNLTTDRTYKIILIPLFGYSAHFERLIRNHSKPDPLTSNNATSADFYTMTSSLPQQLHQTWYGFALGGALQIEPGRDFVLQAGYTHHWLHFAFKNHLKNEVSLFDTGPVLTSSQTTNTKVKTSEGGNIGQSGWMQFDKRFSMVWRIGLGAQIHYFSTRVINASLRETQENSSVETQSSEKYKLRWTSISGWVQTSRQF